jgi:hypothetical protein
MLIDATRAGSTLMVRYTVKRVIRKSLNNTQFIAFHRNVSKLSR